VFVDIRYHIVSIVAVFLALGLGILIGGSITKTASLEKRTDRAIEEIKSQLLRLDEETRQNLRVLQNDIQTYETFGRAILKTVAGSRLQGKAVALLQTGDYPDTTETLRQVLRENGATVASITTLSLSFPPTDDIEANRIAERAGIQATSREEICAQMARLLAQGIASGSRDTIIRLRSAGMITTYGDYTQPVRIVIVLGGGSTLEDNTPTLVDTPLIQTLQAQDIQIIGCEPENAVTSYIPSYQRLGVSTVDNIDRSPGYICLAYLLSGEQGHFGVKNTAERLLPRPFQD